MREIETKWVAGCDGAHSAVRHLTGIDFPGAPYEHVFFVADTVVTGLDGAGRAQRLPLARRLSSLLPDARHESLAAGRDRAAGPACTRRPELRRACCPRSAKEAGSGLSFESCSWFSMYRISHRRAGAVPGPPLLPARRRRPHSQPGRRAGHEHRPAGRLQPRRGSSRSSSPDAPTRGSLDSYELERIPVARAVAQDDRPGLFPSSCPAGGRRGCFARRSCRGSMAFAMRFDRVRRLAFRTVSQIGIRYPASPLSQTLAGLARRRARPRVIASRGCGSSSHRTDRSRICSRSWTTPGSI